MNSTTLVSELDQILKAAGVQGWRVEKPERCPTAHAALYTPYCTAFFVLLESWGDIESTFAQAQGEIAGIQTQEQPGGPRDFELILLLPEAGLSSEAEGTARRIVDDRAVCRKFVLCVDGRRLPELLQTLPFWPVETLVPVSPESVGIGVREVLPGFDPLLVTDLSTQRPGAARIVAKITEGKYRLSGPPPAETVAPSTPQPKVHGVRLTGLDITNFRGIRNLSREELPLSGDIVVIYGPNGIGKTSIVDALEWGVTGGLTRLQESLSRKTVPDPIVNVFASSNPTKVVCYLSDGPSVVRKKVDGQVTCRIGGSPKKRDIAVIDHVVGTKAPTGSKPLLIQALRSLFSNSHLLAQHNIRKFLVEADPRERFDTLTNMIGAEAFVRFREKAADVRKQFGRLLKRRSAEVDLREKEAEAIKRRRTEHNSDLKKLRDVLESGRSADRRISDLLKGLAKAKSDLDTSVLKDLSSQPVLRQIEIVTIHAESALSARRDDLSGLASRLNGLVQRAPRILRLRPETSKMEERITRAKAEERICRGELPKAKKAVGKHQAEAEKMAIANTQLTQRCEWLAWLEANLPSYNEELEAIRRLKESLTSRRKKRNALEPDVQEGRRELGAQEERLQEIENEIVTSTKKRLLVGELLERVDEILRKLAESLSCAKDQKGLGGKITKQRAALRSARAKASNARRRIQALDKRHAAATERHDSLLALLAKLSELVDSAKCPLCGREFSSIREAKTEIDRHLSSLPRELKELAREIEDARKEIQAAEAEVDSVSKELESLAKAEQAAQERRKLASELVRAFLLESRGLGIPLTKSKSAEWRKILQEARRGYSTTQMTAKRTELRSKIKTQKLKVKQLRDQIRQEIGAIDREERKLQRLVASCEQTEASMAKRGFSHRSLPAIAGVKQDVALAGKALEKCKQQLEKKEAEVTGSAGRERELRSKLSALSKDIMADEAKLERQRSTCEDFASECRQLGVDPQAPKESLSSRKKALSKEKRSLAVLESQRYELERLGKAEKLRSETTRLAEEEQSLRKEIRARHDRDSELSNWEKRLGKLEKEVSRQQAVVVGAHLRSLGPTLTQLYQRLNPHPVFEDLNLLFDEDERTFDIKAATHGTPELPAEIVVPPVGFFSAAQLNVLAISVFLAGALRQRWSRFQTIVFDDPIQQMDEMNVYAFLDLVRGLTSERQFIILTCSRDFYLLALEKLGCLNDVKPGSFCAYRLDGIAPADLIVSCDAP